MASNKSVVDQVKLRQMMAKLKDRPESNSKTKKYKVSAATLALMEDEKRKKAEEKAKTKPVVSATPLPKDFFERQPKKSILKNSLTPLPSVAGIQQAGQKRSAPDGIKEKTKKRKMQEVSKSEDVVMEDAEAGTSKGDSGSTLPEGFFDDPIKDAKVGSKIYVSLVVSYVYLQYLQYHKLHRVVSDRRSLKLG